MKYTNCIFGIYLYFIFWVIATLPYSVEAMVIGRVSPWIGVSIPLMEYCFN